MAKLILLNLKDPRTEMNDALGLSGCGLSVNAMPAEASTPFVLYHKENEEIRRTRK